jgi:hypothetical protein
MQISGVPSQQVASYTQTQSATQPATEAASVRAPVSAPTETDFAIKPTTDNNKGKNVAEDNRRGNDNEQPERRAAAPSSGRGQLVDIYA